jgi:oligopeptide/dipeptide ABC transporter ATP-binding protein
MPLLRVERLSKHFPIAVRGLPGRIREAGMIRAVDDVDFSIEAGETLGLVGESGCGKTTVGRTILHLYPPTSGRVIFDGVELGSLSKTELHQIRRNMQMVFQNPFNSFNPRTRLFDAVASPLRVYRMVRSRKQKQEKVESLFSAVGLNPSLGHRYPHEFSGGQLQRLAIARALALKPKFIVADEVVASLDVSIQAQILNLMKKLQKDHNLTYLFISHDLSVVRHLSSRVAVMYLGSIIELGPSDQVFDSPAHPYTQALLSAIPAHPGSAARARNLITGEPPSAIHMPSGCRFHPRCDLCTDLCKRYEPSLVEVEEGHYARCHSASNRRNL